ncbi:hypothetical protein FALBO_1362 [Fusarium albosuccineum]|uniref:DUF7923 domain-containing protein n=1 Tax=Fusarium albosuccineum TaxID=1237068 RepID=A0A8H4LQ19_9HYPO|nr:hypothetical protein FALBO_1362 [Fusarium albosuccineum]
MRRSTERPAERPTSLPCTVGAMPLTGMLDGYVILIEDYKRLESDYEEECEGRERGKQLARGQDHNSFAWSLSLGTGITVSRVAGKLPTRIYFSDVVKDSLKPYPSVCIRAVSAARKTFLSSPTAGFNRSNSLAGFIDAGELKENADFKPKAVLRLYADNVQCNHIYFADHHEVGCVSDLTPNRVDRERFTLIRTPSLLIHEEFKKIDMAIEKLPGVFLHIQLTFTYSVQAQAKSNGSFASTNTDMPCPFHYATDGGPASNDRNMIYRLYIDGKRKYSNSCRFAHIDDTITSPYTNYGSAPSPPSIGNGSKLDRNINSNCHPGSSLSLTKLNVNHIDPLPEKLEIADGFLAGGVKHRREGREELAHLGR